MRYITQPGGFYGGGLGNEGVMQLPAFRFDPTQLVTGNPFGPQFEIPGKKPGGQPVLPGESKEAIEGVYGRPVPRPLPNTFPLGLPMAMGSSNLPNAIGNMGGLASVQMPAGFQGKYVS